MAFTRKWLSALGIEADKVDEIVKAHAETVDALKEEIEKYKTDADKLESIEKERDQLKEAVKKDKTEEYQKKYEEIKTQFDNFKADVKDKEIKATKTNAYKTLLKQSGVSEKRIDSVLRVTDLSKIEFDEDNKIVDADKVAESIKDEWSDFIVSADKKGAQTPKPPANNGSGVKTKEEIMAIKDTAERQQAIAENHELFGF